MAGLFKQLGCGGTIGIFGGLLGALVGLWGVSTAGPIAVIGYVAFLLFFFGIFWKLMFGPMVRANRLTAVGVDAEASILSLHETGSSLKVGGSIPKAGVRLELEVRPEGRPAFRAQISTFVSMFEIQKYQPGAIIRVKFDPKDPRKVVIAEGTAVLGRYQSPAPSGTPVAAPAPPEGDLQKMVDHLAAEEQRLFAVGVEAPARIKRMTETEITVNGDNPLLELTVEVTPAYGDPFTAEAKAVVARSALHKFEPGRTVQVKFDPGDRSQVTVFHS